MIRLFALALVFAGAAAAALPALPALAAEIGTVASVDGSAQIGRGDSWTVAVAGSPLQQGDRVRTGNPGRLRAVFQDDTVLTLEDDTEVVLDESVVGGSGQPSRSVTDLLKGAVNAVVSETYGAAGSEYEIRTATATAGVRGTEFIVSYFPERNLAEVIGISGRVEVRSTLADTDGAVFVTADEVSQVAAGKDPTPAQRLDDELLQERRERFDFVGTTPTESLAAWQGGVGAAGVTVGPRLERFAARQERIRRAHDASNLLSDSPVILDQRQLGVRF